MRRGIKKFQGWLLALTCMLGIQFFLLPLYHFHPDNIHGHQGQLSPHRHIGHFHSHELETLAHFSLARDHDAGTRTHHSHHPGDQEEEQIKSGFNKNTLKPQQAFRVLNNFTDYSLITFIREIETFFFSQPRLKLIATGPKYRLRERSPSLFSV